MMRRILAACLFGLGIATAPLLAQAASCSPSMTFTTGQTLTAAVLNSNPTTFSGCFNNIDATNIGAVGLYASNLNPTNATQATFGGAQNYTFPANVITPGNFVFGGLTTGGTLSGSTGNVAISGGYSAGTPGTTTNGALTFGTNSGAVTQAAIASNNASAAGGIFSTLFGVFDEPSGFNAFSVNVLGDAGVARNLGVNGTETNAGSTSSGAVRQTVGGTTYTVPYDANSTAGSTNTHIERGTVVTGTYSGGLACAPSQNFAKAFTSNPTVVGTMASGAGDGVIYVGGLSGTAVTMCANNLSGGTSGSIATINWIALGE